MSDRDLWVGIGCQRGLTAADLQASWQQLAVAQQLNWAAIAGFATLATKLDELGMRDFCAACQRPLLGLTAEELRAIAVPQPASRVARAVGTPSVAEAAALRAVQLATGSGCLLLPKQIDRRPSGAVTWAIAQPSAPVLPQEGSCHC